MVMLFAIVFAVVFLSLQIYNESALLVELVGNIIPTLNSTLSSNPEINQMLPANILKGNLVIEMMNKGYLHGREWLQTSIRSTFGPDADPLVEKQLLEVWDRIYHLWLMPQDSHSDQSPNGIGSSRNFEAYNWNKLFAAFKNLDLLLVWNLIQENFHLISSVSILEDRKSFFKLK